MNTQRNVARRLEYDIANAEVRPRGDQVPPLEKDANVDKDQVNPPPLTDGDIRASLLEMVQSITSQA